MHTAALLLVLLSAPDAGTLSEADVLALGRRLSADFWAGRLDPVWAQMNARMQGALGGSPVDLSKARDELLRVSGGPGATLGERVAEVQGFQVYLRTFQGTAAEKPALEQWAFDDASKVAGFFVRPTQLSVETLSQPAKAQPGAARYAFAAGLLLGTLLVLGGAGAWLRRRARPAS